MGAFHSNPYVLRAYGFDRALGDSWYDNEHVRWFRMDASEEWACLDRHVETGELLWSESDESPLLDPLAAHSAASLEGASGASDEGTASKDIERRLEALGDRE